MALRIIKAFWRQLRPVREKEWIGVHKPKCLVKAGSIQLSEKLLTTAIALVSTVILSRILPAGVFGLIAMVRFFQTLLMTLSGPGFTEAVVQVKVLNMKQLDGIFLINLFFGIFFGTVMALGGPFIASFYGESELISICHAFGFIFFLQNISQIHLGILQRNLKVEMTAVVSIVPNILNLTCAITLALNGFGVWSIIGGILCGTSMRQLLLWYFVRWRPKSFPVRNCGLRSMVRFGLMSNTAKLVAFISDNMQTLILGKIGNPADVGYFNRAETLYRRPFIQFASPLVRLFLPKMASLQDDRDQLLYFIKRSTWFLAFFLLPFAVLMMVLGDWVMVLLLGAHWEPSGEIVRWIAVAYVPACLSMSLVRANSAIGRPGRTLPLNLVLVVVVSAGFIHYAPLGPLAVVKYLAAVKIISYPFFLALQLRGSGFNWRVYVGSILRLLAFTGFMTLIWLWIRSQLFEVSVIGQVLLIGGVIVITYVTFYLFYRFTEDGADVIHFLHQRVAGVIRKKLA